jgi:two-component system chemotaxis response regulator CheB
MKKIKVFIVDDSAVVRQVLTTLFSQDSKIDVIGSAADPIFAHTKIKKNWPDVIVLDLEMPRMDGLTYLQQIMSERPTPIVICSTLTEKSASITMDALRLGAVDIITKPKVGLKGFLTEESKYIIQTVKAAAQARMVKGKPLVPQTKFISNPKLSADEIVAPPIENLVFSTTDKFIAIGSSTGGTQALEYILTNVPKNTLGIVIVQHMPATFTKAFAERLNSLSPLDIKEAEEGDRIINGSVLVTPGDKHVVVVRSGAQYRVQLKDGPVVSRHKPSVDVLFRSVAKCAGPNATGIILTGMGDDGAHGMLEMKNSGSYNIGQNEESCAVYGMPKEAKKLGGVNIELDLDHIISVIVSRSRLG